MPAAVVPADLSSHPSPQQAFHLLHRSPTQHVRAVDMDCRRKDAADELMDDAKNSHSDVTPIAHANQQLDSPSVKSAAMHKEMQVDTLRQSEPNSAGVVPPAAESASGDAASRPSTASSSSSSGAAAHSELSRPTGLTTSPSLSSSAAHSGDSLHSHQSSTDSSPQQAYRGLKISVASTAVPVTSANQQEGKMVAASGKQDVNPDAMQLATPQPVPASAAADHAAAAPAASAAASGPVNPLTSSSSSHSSTKLNNDDVVSAGGAASASASTVKSPNSCSDESAASSATPAASGRSTASPADSAAGTATPATPAKQENKGRYRPVRTLQNSLFGQVQLAYDTHRQCEVAVKVSHAELVNPKSQLGHTPPSQGADAAATARSQAGVSVLEDVRREARILRLLLGSDQPPLTTDTIDNDTCGLSQPLLHAIHLPANAVVQPGATNPLTIKQQFLDSIAKGKKSIAGFYDEVEAESFHYLISEYISGGDLFSVLTAQPQHKVSEGVARQWFYQLCCSVRYMHAHSVAHLDLSLENICMDSSGRVRLIDFGLAAQHPRYGGDRRSHQSDGAPLRNASNHIKLLDEQPASAACACAACAATKEKLLRSDPAIAACLASGRPISRMKFLCRPVCERVHKPGKLGYMSWSGDK